MENINILKPSPKSFNIIVFGQVISVLGSALLRFALSLYVLDITGRADIYAILYAASNVPLLFGPFGGALADRFNRRNMMMILDFLSSFIVVCFIIVMLNGSPNVLIIGVVMVLLATISAMYTPTVISSIPLLVEEQKLEKSNGLVQAVQSLSNILAPLLGGVLYGYLGLKTMVFFSASTFFISGVMIAFIKIPFKKRKYIGNIGIAIIKDMKIGFSYAFNQSFIRKSIMFAILLNLIITSYSIVGIPIILRVTMKSSDLMYGVGMGFIEMATITGALSVGIFARKMYINKIYKCVAYISILMLVMSLSVMPKVLSLGFYPSFILFILCGFPVMMIICIINIFLVTKVQKITPPENLGKVMSIITAVATCMLPLGQVLYGFSFEIFKGYEYIPTLFSSASMLIVTIFVKNILKNE